MEFIGDFDLVYWNNNKLSPGAMLVRGTAMGICSAKIEVITTLKINNLKSLFKTLLSAYYVPDVVLIVIGTYFI